MKIDHKIQYVEGSFDTKKGKLVAVLNTTWNDVHIAVKSNMNIPIAKIKLYTRDLAIDAKAVQNDAYRLAEEIVRRFNEFPEDQKL